MNTSEAGQASSQEDRDSQLHEELIFKQDLNEVHLLIDFISGRADRSLSTLSMPHPTTPDKMMTSGEIVEAISKMRYPPPETPVINAQNAAILLQAKDKLSVLAAPARGLTIAYTTMFIDAEAGPSMVLGMLRRLFTRRSGPGEPNQISPASTAEGPALLANDRGYRDTRIDLAQRTFPGLRNHARKFRIWRDALAFFTIIWLFLTGLAYWDAGLGRSALEGLDQDWKTIVEEVKDNPSLIRCGQTASPAATNAAGDSKTDGAIQTELACRRYDYLTWLGINAGKQVQAVFVCDSRLTKILHIWCWHWLLSGAYGISGSIEEMTKPQGTGNNDMTTGSGSGEPGLNQASLQRIPDYAKVNAVSWQTATSILTVFTTYILPMMFALLGTLIGAFRAILNRIADSELAPRDLVRMQIGIPTGLVAGIAVGLFLSPSSVPLQGAGGVSGQLTLTASALGFLAGYASYSFFRFLDNILATVFPAGSSAVTGKPTTEAKS